MIPIKEQCKYDKEKYLIVFKMEGYWTGGQFCRAIAPEFIGAYK